MVPVPLLVAEASSLLAGKDVWPEAGDPGPSLMRYGGQLKCSSGRCL